MPTARCGIVRYIHALLYITKAVHFWSRWSMVACFLVGEAPDWWRTQDYSHHFTSLPSSEPWTPHEPCPHGSAMRSHSAVAPAQQGWERSRPYPCRKSVSGSHYDSFSLCATAITWASRWSYKNSCSGGARSLRWCKDEHDVATPFFCAIFVILQPKHWMKSRSAPVSARWWISGRVHHRDSQAEFRLLIWRKYTSKTNLFWASSPQLYTSICSLTLSRVLIEQYQEKWNPMGTSPQCLLTKVRCAVMTVEQQYGGSRLHSSHVCHLTSK